MVCFTCMGALTTPGFTLGNFWTLKGLALNSLIDKGSGVDAVKRKEVERKNNYVIFVTA